MNYIIEKYKAAVSKNGRPYVALSVNDGKTRNTIYVWGPPENFAPVTPSILVATPKTADGFTSVDYNNCDFLNIEDLAPDHPLLTLLERPSVTESDFVSLYYSLCELEPNLEKRQFLMEAIPIEEVAGMYSRYPAAHSNHHAYVGGLLQHVYEIMELYASVNKTIVFRGLDVAAVLLGIVYHDYGKLFDYSPMGEYEDEFYALGHIFIGASHLQKLLDVSAFDTEGSRVYHPYTKRERMLIVHSVLAHHRQLDWGSPVTPCTAEASAVHYLDELSGKLQAYKKAYNKEKTFSVGTVLKFNI